VKKLILLSIIFNTAYCYTMKRQLVHKQEPCNQKKIKLTSSLTTLSITPSLPILPQEIVNIMFDMVVHNLPTKKPREAATTIRALAVTTKAFNAKINNPDFSDYLIKHNASRFFCSHESIAKFLATKQAIERLKLQYELKKLCKNLSNEIVSKKLADLLEKKVDLEFTYNDKGLQKTPLMLAMTRNSWMFLLLLKNKANINTRNAYGTTILHMAATYPVQLSAIEHIITRPDLLIDQQNNRGETALLHSLKNRRLANITLHFTNLIELLLTKADPAMIDKEGNSPFSIAKELRNNRLIEAIDRALERKNAQLLVTTRQI